MKPRFSTQGARGVWGGAPACKYINRPVDSLVNPLTPRKPISTLGAPGVWGSAPACKYINRPIDSSEPVDSEKTYFDLRDARGAGFRGSMGSIV